jgi:hypothetical protein
MRQRENNKQLINLQAILITILTAKSKILNMMTFNNNKICNKFKEKIMILRMHQTRFFKGKRIRIYRLLEKNKMTILTDKMKMK